MHKSVIKTVARLHGYEIYRNLLSKSQYWPAERRDKYVLEQLRTTLVRAWEGVPYYRDEFKKCGFDPRTDFRSPSDLSHLPLIDKQAVRDNAERLLDPRYRRGSVLYQTSGSTGEPMQMHLNESFIAFDYGCQFRQWSYVGYRFRAPFAAFRTYVPARPQDALWRYDRYQNAMYFSAYHLTPANCGQYLEQLLRFRPQIVRGYASSINVLAEYAYAVREKLGFIKGVFTSSETLSDSERENIERTFGQKLFNWYGMTEPALVLTECEKHEGMHVNWEYGYGEFLPAEGLPPNHFRLVTTGFHNPVMPFVRYDTGDIVELFDSPRACACGRNLPLAKTVSGRKDEYIIMPDGRKLPSLNFYSVFRKYPQIVRFQIVQYGRNEIVAKVLFRRDCREVPETLEAVRRDLLLRIGSGVALELEVTDRFVTNSDGKMLAVLRKLGNRSVEEKNEYATSLKSLELAWKLEKQGDAVFKMDWNEPDRLPSPRVRQALRSLVENDHSSCWYPDPDSSRLMSLLSEYVGIAPEHILLTHGSDLGLELMSTVFTHPGDKVLLLTPNYDYFRAMTEQRGADIVRFDYFGGDFPLDAFLQRLQEVLPRLVYITNPNNPIGYVIEPAVLDRIAEECSRISSLLVIDEAYVDFYGTSAVDLVQKHARCVISRTFSKAFGMAGLRLGYLVAPLEILQLLKRIHIAKSVTIFAKTAAQASLEDIASVRAYVREVCESRERFYAFFDEQGIDYRRSYSNFITFEYQQAADLVRFLAERNILVRDGSRYSKCGGAVRVTVTGAQGTEAVIQAIRDYQALASAPTPAAAVNANTVASS